MHVGLIVIGLKGLGRKELGTKVLSLLLDKSWKTDVKKANSKETMKIIPSSGRNDLEDRDEQR